MEQIKKKMANLKKQQDEAEEKARKAEEELAETNAKAQAVSRPKLWTNICNGFYRSVHLFCIDKTTHHHVTTPTGSVMSI